MEHENSQTEIILEGVFEEVVTLICYTFSFMQREKCLYTTLTDIITYE